MNQSLTLNGLDLQAFEFSGQNRRRHIESYRECVETKE